MGISTVIPFSHASEYTQICIDKVWIESTKGKIACVTPTTAEKLVERGWGTLFDEEQFTTNSQSNLLPSWNSGNPKQKIIEFVDKVTNPSSSAFVPAEDRIATFDVDGTLWIEKPQWVDVLFHVQDLKKMTQSDENLRSISPYREIWNDDSIIYQGDKIFNELNDFKTAFPKAYSNISQEEYTKIAKNFLQSNHPTCGVPFRELTYEPMMELIRYLKQNDFKIFLVSGAPTGLLRSVSEEVFGLPTENVIGTHANLQFDENNLIFLRTDLNTTLNANEQKDINIQK
ncbi:MAG: haloacid dehalogenase-like hydrolase [Nitrosopumilus sp.]|nr:haloacid dehalogenase-like hydrolase [Nitrosopumilus sp.]MDH3488578.1 haloacid dehalogenase-like hydrolase [Nitrosopumilus sp.]